MDYLNLIKILSSYVVSSELKRPVMSGLPPAISLELTNHCNLHCPECPSGNGTMKRPRGYMDSALFRKIIEELNPFLLNMNLYFQGEPMLHPEFFSITESATRIHTTVSTNGHFLDPENCDRLSRSGLNKLIISLDGFDEKTYRTYRINGDLNKVTDGIRNLSRAIKKNKSSLKIVIQVLVNRYNENQLPLLRTFAARNDASLVLKSMQIYYDKEYWMPSSEALRRYESIGGSYRIKGKLSRMCSRLWFNPVITWDGKVLPCCFDKDAKYMMGDMSSASFKDIWFGQNFKEFRKMIMKESEKTEICRNCTSGLRRVRT